jgi:glyoxylase-like metal-dependent hydrolase (beta-lactamase superfamily II)
LQEVAPGIYMWSTFSEEKGYAFNGFAVSSSEGTLLIDPPEPANGWWEPLDELGPFEGVYTTNRNHARAATLFGRRYGVPVRAHASDADRLATPPDETLNGGESIGQTVEVIHVPGKSPGEVAFYIGPSNALIVGDVVIGVPSGQLSVYPDELVDDKVELFRSAAKLVSYDFDALLLCDGKPLLTGGRQALREFVERQEG